MLVAYAGCFPRGRGGVEFLGRDGFSPHFDRRNSLTIRPECFLFLDEGRWRAMAGVGAAYVFSGLECAVLPSRGFRGRIDCRLRFDPGSAPFGFLGVDLAAAGGHRPAPFASLDVGTSGLRRGLF